MRWLLLGLVATLIAAGSWGARALPTVGGAEQVPGGQALGVPSLAGSVDDPSPDDPPSIEADFGRFAALAIAATGPEGDDLDEDDLEEDELALLLEQPLRWHTDYETVLALSERAGKPILARFR